MGNKEQLLKAIIEEPSNYKIDVLDNTMLPEDLKEKEVIIFTVKPPVLSVLAKCALVLENIPDELKEPGTKVKFEDSIKYVPQMAEIFAILAHGKTSKYPDWYVPFIINNTTPKEIFYLFQEVALKTQSSFFLNSSQIASITNPMTMM